MAIVGESGAGKSVLVKAVLGLLPPQLQVTSGQVRYGEVDLLSLDKSTLRSLRSKHIAATLANAKSQLHPLTTVGGILPQRSRRIKEVSAPRGSPTVDRAVAHGRHERSRTSPRGLSA